MTTLTKHDLHPDLVRGDSPLLPVHALLLPHHVASLQDVAALLNKDTLQDVVTLLEGHHPPVAVVSPQSVAPLQRAPEPRVERVELQLDLDHLATVLTAHEHRIDLAILMAHVVGVVHAGGTALGAAVTAPLGVALHDIAHPKLMLLYALPSLFLLTKINA